MVEVEVGVMGFSSSVLEGGTAQEGSQAQAAERGRCWRALYWRPPGRAGGGGLGFVVGISVSGRAGGVGLGFGVGISVSGRAGGVGLGFGVWCGYQRLRG